MNFFKENIKYLVIIGLFVVVVSVSLQRKKTNEVIVEMYKPVPDFTLYDRSGKQIKLSDYRGKVVFLNFWASWCEPCKEEMPSMELLYRTLKGRGLEMIAINVERMERVKSMFGQSEVKTFVDDLNLSFQVIHDGWGAVDRAYKLTGVPETYIIDQDGILVEKIVGARDWTQERYLQTIYRLLDNG